MSTSKPSDFSQLRAFIVDDNENMRLLLRRLLNVLGLRMIGEHVDGASALADLARLEPDFILTDLSMVPMDGVAFTQAIRRSTDAKVRVLPIIMITGHTERSRIEAARDAGVSEILAKPVTPANLYHRIEQIILKPRSFISSATYFGPDRRRQRNPYYGGPLRRASDKEEQGQAAAV
jgi:two-component system chemotaxis response regulator CheY